MNITSCLKNIFIAASALVCLSNANAQTSGQATGDKGSVMGIFNPTDAPNTPMGVAKGIHPGRVAWAFDPKAAAWDGKSGLYSDAANNSQTRVDEMIEGIVISLTDKDNITDAWHQLFTTLNEKKGKGAVGYKPGEKIAIKINLNDNGGSNIVDATPQSVYALLKQLIEVVGVPQECITVYDAQRRGISAVYNYVEPLYPNVVYQNWGGFVPDVVQYSAEITDPDAKSIARAAYEADYMINMALMKRHSQPTDDWKDSAGQTGITCTGKNHFGTIGKPSALHLTIRDWSNYRGMATYNSIVDLMSHPLLGADNTLLFIADAMYVNPKHNGKAVKYQNTPFNDGWTSSFFASLDQVALESVILDFIFSEMPLAANADNFLHEAALIGNPPSKTAYIGADKVSLGVHEHWNNPIDKQYSRNLGTGLGIELYQVPLAADRPAIEYFYADQLGVYGKAKTDIHWSTSSAAKVTLNGKEVAASGSVTLPQKSTTEYTLEVTGTDGKTVSQSFVVRDYAQVVKLKPQDANLEGEFIINGKKQLTVTGERTKTPHRATWTVKVPEAGDYTLCANYNGTDPVPAYIYINGDKVTENFGFLSTVSDAPREFYFPVTLNKGENTITYEMTGTRVNSINHFAILKENK